MRSILLCTKSSSTPSERRLTVGTQYYEYPSRVPWLQMRGDWFAAAGFDIRTPVRVRVIPGCLVLTVDQPGQQCPEG